jgi:hypothetical protein
MSPRKDAHVADRWGARDDTPGHAHYRDLFCREAGFDHVSRYVTGLILSPNKTLQGFYDLRVWATEQAPSRRAMHEAVLEAGWDAERLMPCHRAVIAPAYRGRGRAVLSLDWTYVHHERGVKIWGVKPAWDHVEHRMVPYQTGVTAVIASRERLDGVEVVVQSPDRHAEEEASLQETGRQSYEQLEEARRRVVELLHYLQHRLGYKKRTEIALELVHQLEHEGHFPQAHYAFDNGVLPVHLTRYIESVDHGPVPQWGHQAVLRIYQSGTPKTLWAETSGHRVRDRRPQ